jgi:hypothetical protein
LELDGDHVLDLLRGECLHFAPREEVKFRTPSLRMMCLEPRQQRRIARFQIL